jgi:hypothetical protein
MLTAAVSAPVHRQQLALGLQGRTLCLGPDLEPTAGTSAGSVDSHHRSPAISPHRTVLQPLSLSVANCTRRRKSVGSGSRSSSGGGGGTSRGGQEQALLKPAVTSSTGSFSARGLRSLRDQNGGYSDNDNSDDGGGGRGGGGGDTDDTKQAGWSALLHAIEASGGARKLRTFAPDEAAADARRRRCRSSPESALVAALGKIARATHSVPEDSEESAGEWTGRSTPRTAGTLNNSVGAEW